MLLHISCDKLRLEIVELPLADLTLASLTHTFSLSTDFLGPTHVRELLDRAHVGC